MASNFIECLEYEASQMEIADKFYREYFPGCTIFRPKYNGPEDQKELQRNDVDVVISRPGQPDLFISEKFRNSHFPDVMIELYSDWNRRVEGWALKTKPDYHIFFHSHYSTGANDIQKEVRIIPSEDIRAMAIELNKTGEQMFNDVMQTGGKKKFVGELEYRMFKSVRGFSAWWGATVIVPIERFKRCKILYFSSDTYPMIGEDELAVTTTKLK